MLYFVLHCIILQLQLKQIQITNQDIKWPSEQFLLFFEVINELGAYYSFMYAQLMTACGSVMVTPSGCIRVMQDRRSSCMSLVYVGETMR